MDACNGIGPPLTGHGRSGNVWTFLEGPASAALTFIQVLAMEEVVGDAGHQVRPSHQVTVVVGEVMREHAHLLHTEMI